MNKLNNLIIEFDLAGAEWVVVAHLSGDENMLGVVKSGKSPHIVTGSLISGVPEDLVEKDHKVVGSATDPVVIEKARREIAFPEGAFLPRSMSIRQAGKKSNHGLNYDMRYRRFALENEMQEGDAEPIVRFYREKAYPRVFDTWHPDIRRELKDNGRCMTNCFGRKVRLLDEWGPELFAAAYSFKPQSTVFDCVRHAMIKAYFDNSLPFKPIRLGAQVHDSLMIRYPIPTSRDEWYTLASTIQRIAREYMCPPLVYRDTPFKLRCDVKMGWSWGRMRGVPVEEDIDSQVNTIQAVASAVIEAEQKLEHLAHPQETTESEVQTEAEWEHSPIG